MVREERGHDAADHSSFLAVSLPPRREIALHTQLDTMRAMHEYRFGRLGFRGEISVRLIHMNDVIALRGERECHLPPIGTWELEEIVEIAVSDAAAEAICPDLVDVVAKPPECRDRLHLGTGSTGVPIRRNIGHDKNAHQES